MTTKTIKVLSGDRAKYSVSKDGYKTVNGTTSAITNDTVVDVNLEIDYNKVLAVWTGGLTVSSDDVYSDEKYIATLINGVKVYSVPSPILKYNNTLNQISFFRNRELTSLDYLDTTDFYPDTGFTHMFDSCNYLVYVYPFDTSKGLSFLSMFSGCYSLTSIPQFDTRNATNMKWMFKGCASLPTIPQLDTRNVSSMEEMFFNCTSLTSIPQLDTSKVSTMSGMFENCTSLRSVPELDSGNTYYITRMFDKCTSLTDFGGLKDIGKNGHWSRTVSFSDCPLTYQSALNVLNDLWNLKGTVMSGRKLQFSAQTYNLLTLEDIKIGTDKGWSIVASIN